jgi:glycerophosphoryl diester phosphodiesterase
MPNGCRETILPLPINLAPWLWGWPRRFEARMAAAESIIVLFGPYERGDAGSSGIDGREQVELIPIGFDGYVSTNRIDSVRPLLTAP